MSKAMPLPPLEALRAEMLADNQRREARLRQDLARVLADVAAAFGPAVPIEDTGVFVRKALASFPKDPPE